MSTEQLRERLTEKRQAIDLALNELDAMEAQVEREAGPVATVATVAKEVLIEGQPLKTKPLAAAILAKGFPTRSKDFYPVVYKAMRSHGEFENTKQGWMLKAS